MIKATHRNTALLVVDVQLGMFESPVIRPVHDAARLLPTVVSLVDRARQARVPVFFVQHDGGKGHPLQKGTAPWRIHPALGPKRGEFIVHKRFCDSFQRTMLHRLLQARRVRHLVVCGIQSDFCVDTACRRAFSLDYKVTLVEDAHSTWDNGILKASQIMRHHNRTLAENFVTLAKAGDLFAANRRHRTAVA